jgi:rhodanese-related sulfurtransferase
MTRFTSFLFLLLLTVSCNTTAQTALSVDDFSKAIQQPNVQILDVRTISEYNSGFLKNALQADWNNKQQFADRTQHLDKSKPVYVYCLSGARSGAAAAQLRAQGYNAINLEGGMNAWKRAGKPVEGLKDVPQMSANEYATLTSSASMVLVDFGATWCPPCKKMEPVIQQLKVKMDKKVQISYVDGGLHTVLMDQQKVEALPTFILYKSGKEVWRKQGIVTEEEFTQVINRFQ